MQVAKVPDLCIHLRKDRTSVKVDPDLHLRVVFGLSAPHEGGRETGDTGYQFQPLWQDIARQLQCSPEDIMDFDLCFADSQPAAFVVVWILYRGSGPRASVFCKNRQPVLFLGGSCLSGCFTRIEDG